jgi:hypothetical protein
VAEDLVDLRVDLVPLHVITYRARSNPVLLVLEEMTRRSVARARRSFPRGGAIPVGAESHLPSQVQRVPEVEPVGSDLRRARRIVQMGSCSVGPEGRSRPDRGGGSGAPAAGRPARPLVRSSRRPSSASLRRLPRGLQPWDSGVASTSRPVLCLVARILAPWDERSCSTRRTSRSRWWPRDGP